MIIKDLIIKFDRQEPDKTFFKTEAGQELAIDNDLLPDDFDKEQSFYLSIDQQPVASGGGREILNDLLNPDN